MHWKISILILFAAVGCLAESWTNAAGHAVEAELVSRNGDVLTMKRKNGTMFSIHRKALSKECQASVDKKIPPEYKPSHDEIVTQRQKQRLKLLQERKK